MEKSKNSVINDGWYRGLPRDVIEKTGCGKPVVLTTLKSGDVSTDKREFIIKTALKLVKANKARKEKIQK